jgi:hypothetical protein
MDDAGQQLALLQDLESRQDDLLRQLDELDQRVETVLRQWTEQRREEG